MRIQDSSRDLQSPQSRDYVLDFGWIRFVKENLSQTKVRVFRSSEALCAFLLHQERRAPSRISRSSWVDHRPRCAVFLQCSTCAFRRQQSHDPIVPHSYLQILGAHKDRNSVYHCANSIGRKPRVARERYYQLRLRTRHRR